MKDRHPEWLDDEPNDNMTFDESGQFVSVKELKSSRRVETAKSSGSSTKPDEKEARGEQQQQVASDTKSDHYSNKDDSRIEQSTLETSKADLEKNKNQVNMVYNLCFLF